MQFGVRVIGERRIALRFEQFPEIARAKFVEIITTFQQNMQALVESKIPKRSGRLAASITGGVESTKDKVRGWVNVGGKDKALILQAAALEYGADSSVKVKAKAGRGLKTVYGRYVNPMQVNVSAYSRQANIVAQRFLRDSLAAQNPAVLDAMEAALEAAVQEADSL